MGTNRTSGGSKGAGRAGGRAKGGGARKAAAKKATAKKKKSARKATAKKRATAKKKVTGKRAKKKTTARNRSSASASTARPAAKPAARRKPHLSMGTATSNQAPTLASRIAAIGDALTEIRIGASSLFTESAPSTTSKPPPALHFATFADRVRRIGRSIADRIRNLNDAA